MREVLSVTFVNTEDNFYDTLANEHGLRDSSSVTIHSGNNSDVMNEILTLIPDDSKAEEVFVEKDRILKFCPRRYKTLTFDPG
jgi:hypothetical protein